MNTPDIQELLKSGVHFGHQKTKRYPTMREFVWGTRGGIDIIDLEKTQAKLQAALEFVRNIGATGGTVLFVGTKRQAKAIVTQAAQACGMPYVVERWLGGTFTNFKSIMQMTQKLTRIEQEQQTGEIKRFTKKEQNVLLKEAVKLQLIVGTLKQLKSIPQAVYIIDVKYENTAVQEANKMGVPVVAVCDTNINPRLVQWLIPGNDDAVKAIELMTNLIAEALKDGQTHPGSVNLEKPGK